MISLLVLLGMIIFNFWINSAYYAVHSKYTSQVDDLGLNERQVVTREWLQKKGTDSIGLWRKKDNYSVINIDFAPISSFELFMNNESITVDE